MTCSGEPYRPHLPPQTVSEPPRFRPIEVGLPGALPLRSWLPAHSERETLADREPSAQVCTWRIRVLCAGGQILAATVLGGAAGGGRAPWRVSGDPTSADPPPAWGLRGDLDSPSAGSHVSPLFPSGVSLLSTRSRARLDLWGQVVGAGEPPLPGQHPRWPPCPPRCFRPVLAHVQLLWELMLLGEPLLVLAPSPAVSSEMVLALTR